MSKIDTSISGYKSIGINLTQEQLDDMAIINTMMKEDTGKEVPVHCVLLILKSLKLLPPELMCEVSNDKTADDTQNICDYEFQKRYGKLKECERFLNISS